MLRVFTASYRGETRSGTFFMLPLEFEPQMREFIALTITKHRGPV